MHGLQAQWSKVTSARDLPGADSRREVRLQRIDLNYSTTSGISRAGPALKTLIVCIIQVRRFVGYQEEDRVGNLTRACDLVENRLRAFLGAKLLESEADLRDVPERRRR